MNEITKTVYYGRTITEAADNCLGDQHCYDEKVKGYQIISARRLAQGLTGFEWAGEDTVEAWEFELFLLFK